MKAAVQASQKLAAGPSPVLDLFLTLQLNYEQFNSFVLSWIKTIIPFSLDEWSTAVIVDGGGWFCCLVVFGVVLA